MLDKIIRGRIRQTLHDYKDIIFDYLTSCTILELLGPEEQEGNLATEKIMYVETDFHSAIASSIFVLVNWALTHQVHIVSAYVVHVALLIHFSDNIPR